VEIAFHGVVVVDDRPKGVKVFEQITRPEHVLRILHAVFSDDHRQSKLVPPLDRFHQSLRNIGDETRFTQNHTPGIAEVREHLPGRQQIKPDGVARIIINSHKVLGAHSFRDAGLLHNRIEHPILQRPGEKIIEQGMEDLRRPAVHREPGGGPESPVMKGGPDSRFRLQLMDHGIGAGMRPDHGVHHFQRGFKVLLPRREDAFDIGTVDKHIRLIDRHPQIAIGSEGFDRLPDKSRKQRNQILILPPPQLSHPKRLAEMVQGHHGRDLAGLQPDQHLTVTIQGGLVPAVRRGLDPAPGNGQPVSVLMGRLRAVKVLLPASAPPITGHRRRRTVNDPARLLFPGGPGVVGVAPLHLMGGCGGSPEEPLGKGVDP